MQIGDAVTPLRSATDRHIRLPIGRVRRKLTGQNIPFGHPPRRAAWFRRAQHARYCNICGWSGLAFLGIEHSESNRCEQCGSIARDRFNFYVGFNSEHVRLGAVVLETSPRLGLDYLRAMKRLYSFRTGDYDASAHVADMFLDLQDMSLQSDSVDLFMTAHVLEHVPDPRAAAKELARVLKPGGRAVVAIPLLNGRTRKPSEPEYHEDNTLVHWRFGWDLQELLESAGLTVEIMVTEPFEQVLKAGVWSGTVSGEYELPSILAEAPAVKSVMGRRTAEMLGLNPSYQFVAFVCKKAKRA